MFYNIWNIHPLILLGVELDISNLMDSGPTASSGLLTWGQRWTNTKLFRLFKNQFGSALLLGLLNITNEFLTFTTFQ